MSATDCGKNLGDILADFTDWEGPVRINDLAPVCCDACGVEPRPDQPCAILENVLTAKECQSILQFAESHHGKVADGLEPGCRSQFGSEDPKLVGLLWERIKSVIPAEVDTGQAIGLLNHVQYAKYFPGQVGFPHMDFRHGKKDDPLVCSRISFTVYLNEDFEGGTLDFLAGVRADGMGFNPAHTTIAPKAGTAAIFYQGVPQFTHEPRAVRTSCKHIMRADVMYKFQDHVTADVGGLLQQ